MNKKLYFLFFLGTIILLSIIEIINIVNGVTYFDATTANYIAGGAQDLVLGALFRYHQNETEECNNYFYVNITTNSASTPFFRLYTSDKTTNLLFSAINEGNKARINYTLVNGNYYYIAGDNAGSVRNIGLSNDMSGQFPVNNSHFNVISGGYKAYGATDWTNGTQYIYEIEGITIECTVSTNETNDSVIINLNAFGDSITAGSLIGASSTYVKWLDDTINFTVVNHGYDGDNTSKLINRIDEVINQKNGTILLAGTNDQFTTDRERFYNNLLNITQELLNDNQQVLISTIPPCNTSLNGFSCTEINQSLSISYNDVIRKVSYEKDLCYVDIFTEVFNGNYSPSQFYNNDGVHPTEAAHKLMNSTYFNAYFNCESFNCSAYPEQCYNITSDIPDNETETQANTTIIYTNLTQLEYLNNQTLFINTKIYGVLSQMGIIIIFIVLLILGLIFKAWLLEIFAGLFGIGLGLVFANSYALGYNNTDIYPAILCFILGLAILLNGIVNAIFNTSNASGLDKGEKKFYKKY